MVLDLEDPGILARITLLSDGRTRLVLEYDHKKYRDVILRALCEMLRPAPPQPIRKRGRPKKETADE